MHTTHPSGVISVTTYLGLDELGRPVTPTHRYSFVQQTSFSTDFQNLYIRSFNCCLLENTFACGHVFYIFPRLRLLYLLNNDKIRYNPRTDWSRQRALSEYRCIVSNGKLNFFFGIFPINKYCTEKITLLDSKSVLRFKDAIVRISYSKHF